jgi:hypothetical protein
MAPWPIRAAREVHDRADVESTSGPEPALEAYTGSALAAVQHVGVGLFQPGLDSWRHGDREVMCYLTPLDGTTSQSYKDVRP